MEKVIIDTCFLNRFKRGSGLEDDFGLLMKEMDYEILIHPYIREYELDMFYYVDEYIDKGILKNVSYEDFLFNDFEKRYYRDIFIEIYNEFCERQQKLNPVKAKKMKKLDQDTDVFKIRRSGASIGDVHIILLALFEDISIILSEDNKDMIEIYKIASKRMERDGYHLRIYKVKNVIESLEKRDNCNISGKVLRRLKRAYCKSI